MASQHGDDTNNHHALGISGSLRKASANLGLLRAAEQVVPQGMDIAVFDPRDLPFYNGDVEAKGDPGPVIALKEAIRAADAVLFATPESRDRILITISVPGTPILSPSASGTMMALVTAGSPLVICVLERLSLSSRWSNNQGPWPYADQAHLTHQGCIYCGNPR